MGLMTPRVFDLYYRNVTEPHDFERIAKAGYWGIIHKASEGSTFKDPKYKQRRLEALDAGLLWGAYHFATGADVKDQVDNFLNHVMPDRHTLICLDFEDYKNNSMSLAQAREWLGYVYAATGQRPVIYSGNRLKDQLNGKADPMISQHRLWLAQYGPKAKLPPGFTNYFLWQYTGDGIGPEPHDIPGTKLKNQDLNVVPPGVTRADLAAAWALGAEAAVPVVVEQATVVDKPDFVPPPGQEALELPASIKFDPHGEPPAQPVPCTCAETGKATSWWKPILDIFR